MCISRPTPPGLYWYHPHVHMLAEPAVYGGAPGALIVDGINNVQPAVGGLSERVIVIRDLPFKDPALASRLVKLWGIEQVSTQLFQSSGELELTLMSAKS